jgi:hypothetical protein
LKVEKFPGATIGKRVVLAIHKKVTHMPPRGIKKGTKRARQCEHIRKSKKRQGQTEARAEEIAARTVQKERARSGGGPPTLDDLDASLNSRSRRAAE